VLGSLGCDCAARLEKAMDVIVDEGRGVVVYVRSSAEHRLEHRVYTRDRGLGAEILRDLGVAGKRLIAPSAPENVAYLHTTHEKPGRLLTRAG
jgi:GTP cyclohydrolase II